MENIAADFADLHERLLALQKAYNPRGENLHFYALERVDQKLYAEFLALCEEGLAAVERHRDHFLQEPLYADGMFWYELFLMIKAAGACVFGNKAGGSIPQGTAHGITKALVGIAEFSTVHLGDIVKRNAEALSTMLGAFRSDELDALVVLEAQLLYSDKARRFVLWIAGKEEGFSWQDLA